METIISSFRCLNTSPLSSNKYKIFGIQEQWTWILKFISGCTGCSKIIKIIILSWSLPSIWHLILPHHHHYQLPPHHLYRVSQKKFLSQFLDLALIMGACLNPLCNPARVSSQLANEVLSPAFQKVFFLDTLYINDNIIPVTWVSPVPVFPLLWGRFLPPCHSFQVQTGRVQS